MLFDLLCECERGKDDFVFSYAFFSMLKLLYVL